MDEDTLGDALDRWVDAGVLDEESATSIRRYEAQRDAGGAAGRRVVSVVGVMGAILIGAGIITFLAANWQEIGVPIRTAILVVVPVSAAGAGLVLDRRAIPLAGRALWILGALLVGPSLFLLSDIHAPTIALYWLLLGWGVIALPMGHAFETRLVVGLGIATLLLAVIDLGTGETGAFVAAALGTAVIAAGISFRSRVRAVFTTYLILGFAPLVGTLLWVNTLEGRLDAIDVLWGGYLLGGLGVAGLSAAAIGFQVYDERLSVDHALAVLLPLVGTLLALAVIGIEQGLPEIWGYLLIQAILLATLVGIVVAGVSIGSRGLINFVAIAFLLQVVTLLLTLADHVSGSIALIVGGVVLLAVAIALERGRRRLLGRLPTEA